MSRQLVRRGNGATPEEAVNDNWRKYVEELPAGHRIVLDVMGKNRRYATWNGFMWDVKPAMEATR